MSLEAIVIQAGQGKALSLRGTQVAYKAEGQRPAGGPTFLEFTAAPGFNTGDHIHRQIEGLSPAVEDGGRTTRPPGLPRCALASLRETTR